MTKKTLEKSITYNKIPDMVGKTFGYLTVLGFSHVSQSTVFDKRYNKSYLQKQYWLRCECICGKEVNVTFYALGRTTGSCGCVNGADKRRKYQDPLEANAREAFYFYSKNNSGDLTFEQFRELSSKSCVYCGCPPSNITRGSTKRGFRFNNPFIYSGLDRIDSNKPHNFDNCVPCCYFCNLSKSNRSEKEFLKWINDVYKTNKERMI